MEQLIGIPEGYTAHDGGACPLDGDPYVVTIVRTAEGLGHAGADRASCSEWNEAAHANGIGAVVAYRPASRGEEIDRFARWPEQ